MPPYLLNSGVTARITLHFGASASPNPGTAAWGAIADVATRRTFQTERFSAQVGETTSNVAEYLGLIGGLRRVIAGCKKRGICYPQARVRIYGDSKLVVDQVNGLSNDISPLLAPLHHPATHLLASILDVEVIHCSRAENADAVALANEARQEQRPSTVCKALFYPCLSNFVEAWVHGTYTLASHDFGASESDHSCFIDAAFLFNLPQGQALFRDIRDPHPLSVVMGKVSMVVLGRISLNVGVTFAGHPTGQPQIYPQKEAVLDVIVVHSLPVPFHVSHYYYDIKDFSMHKGELFQFRKENLPHRFRTHSSWHNDISNMNSELQ